MNTLLVLLCILVAAKLGERVGRIRLARKVLRYADELVDSSALDVATGDTKLAITRMLMAQACCQALTRE